MSEPAHALESEPPELIARNVAVAGHLLASATAFFFLAFVFAYVYLRSLNSDGQWHPATVHAPVALGSAVAALFVLSAASVRLAHAGPAAGRTSKLALALLFGLAALVVQVVEWTIVGFGPADGGYASVFVGWTGFYFAFAFLSLYWIETQLATLLRNRSDPLVGLGSLSLFWTFYAGVGLLSWAVLYLVTP